MLGKWINAHDANCRRKGHIYASIAVINYLKIKEGTSN
jgi:hypothetical protein